jgi:hypothetical protein
MTMSIATTTRETPRMPWAYLGGYLAFFLGLAGCILGEICFCGGPRGVPPMDKRTCLALIGLAIAVSAAGSLLMARSEQIRSCHLSGLIVCFVMTPLPSLVGLLINLLGNHLRKTASTTLQVILIGAGFFLLALSVSWGWNLFQAGAARQDFRAFAWAILADLGVISLLLAALPTLLPAGGSRASASAVVDPALVSGPGQDEMLVR